MRLRRRCPAPRRVRAQGGKLLTPRAHARPAVHGKRPGGGRGRITCLRGRGRARESRGGARLPAVTWPERPGGAGPVVKEHAGARARAGRRRGEGGQGARAAGREGSAPPPPPRQVRPVRVRRGGSRAAPHRLRRGGRGGKLCGGTLRGWPCSRGLGRVMGVGGVQRGRGGARCRGLLGARAPGRGL